MSTAQGYQSIATIFGHNQTISEKLCSVNEEQRVHVYNVAFAELGRLAMGSFA